MIGHKTLDRLNAFRRGVYHNGHAHTGGNTGIGQQGLAILPPDPVRLQDHEDCADYAECLDAAARRPGCKRVCVGCKKYEHVEYPRGEIMHSNYATVAQWAVCG